MRTLLSSMLSHLKKNEPVVLCSILASSGSSPRGAGAKMAVFADGTSLGTIGGGAVERIATGQAFAALQSGTSSMHAFDLSPDQVNSIGMICGGAVTVYYQYFSPQDAACVAMLRKWLEVIEQQRAAWLYMALTEDTVTDFAVYTDTELPEDRKTCFGAKALLTGNSPVIYTEPISRPGRVYIFGGGHVGAALVPVLSAIDFRVTVFDNRPDFATADHYPAADCVILGDYKSIGEQITLTKYDYVIIMTPGHQADYEVLEQALRSEASYIGCIGSQKKIARTNERLREAGLNDTQISRVHAPIGLDILAETPAEIAISVAAELIRHRKETV